MIYVVVATLLEIFNLLSALSVVVYGTRVERRRQQISNRMDGSSMWMTDGVPTSFLLRVQRQHLNGNQITQAKMNEPIKDFSMAGS